ncbi:MAG: alanine racemase [Deltaproteobacteria bacterium]|nr:alanine racemase [Deltaproteobacteria bacterium]
MPTTETTLSWPKATEEFAEPILPHAELQDFCAFHFDRRKLYLQPFKDGHTSPLYLFDQAILRERAQRFQATFKAVLPALSTYYAVKSNNHPEVARTLIEEGLGLDVSSGIELTLALDLDCKEIIFSGPGKTDQELALAVAHAERTTILLDSFGELERLEKIAGAEKKELRVGVRLTTEGNPLWRKFGIALNRLPEFWEKAQACKHINLQGLQYHSSWNLTPDRQLGFIATLGELLAKMPATFLENLYFIDLGGGFWPEPGEWLQAQATRVGTIGKAFGHEIKDPLKHYRLPALPLANFAQKLGQALTRHIFPKCCCRVCFEPGRWLCHDAMHLLITVVDKKADDLAITDAGTNTIGWERFESDYFPVLNLSRPELTEHSCDILGSLCTPHDIWGYSYWGETLQEGDTLMIPSQGAYTYSLRQNFIKAPAPVVVLAKQPATSSAHKTCTVNTQPNQGR